MKGKADCARILLDSRHCRAAGPITPSHHRAIKSKNVYSSLMLDPGHRRVHGIESPSTLLARWMIFKLVRESALLRSGDYPGPASVTTAQWLYSYE